MRQIVKFMFTIGLMSFVNAGAAHSEDTIKFGLISAFSGFAATWGEVEAVSVEIAVEDINRKGGILLNGKRHKLELFKYDHAYDTATAVTVARQAVQQDNIAFVEVLGGGIIPAIQSITEPAKTLLFGQAGGSHWLGKDKKYSFQPFYSIGENALEVLRCIRDRDHGAKKLALIYPDDDMGESIALVSESGAREIGFEVERYFVQRSVTDFYPLFASIMRNPPDYIDVDGMPGAQYAILAKQARENGYEGDFIFASTLDHSAFEKLGANDTIVGSFVAPAWTTWPTDEGKHWLEEVDKRLPGNRQMWTGRSYDNLMLLKAAIEKANSLDTDVLAKALTSVTAVGVSGEVRYAELKNTDYGAKHLMSSTTPVGIVKKNSDGSLEVKRVCEN